MKRKTFYMGSAVRLFDGRGVVDGVRRGYA